MAIRTWTAASLAGAALLANSLAFADPDEKLSPKQIAEQTIPSVALIRTPNGLGTGFVVRADGRIATNLHVIEGAGEMTVVIGKREFSRVLVVATDPLHDLAILSVPAKGLRPLLLGDSKKIAAGAPVVAIGHPLGLGNTVSDGLVSAVREVQPGLSMLQVSAPFSPGSSGGPLIGEDGRVIGISTLVVAGGQNLNFGMPVEYLQQLMTKPETAMTLAVFAKRSNAQVRRAIPEHPPSLLFECDDGDLTLIEEEIARAINLGAPLYNEGNHEACFRIYEGTAFDVRRKLKKRCRKASSALMDGVEIAGKAGDYTAKAWAMRDAFDGLLAAIDRKRGPALPAVPKRQVPRHDLSLLDGCSDADVQTIYDAIGGAIDVGAPLYNQGNAEACYRVYAGAALELTRGLARCEGPKRALADGLARARSAGTPVAKAWAMRDAFDGLADIILERQRSR